MSRVALGIIHDARMDSLFVRSLSGLLLDRREQIAGTIYVGGGAGRLDNARNEVAKRFAQTTCDYLVTLDTDMVFALEDFDKLLSHDEPIISGAYFVDERPPRAAFANTVGTSIKSVDDWEDGAVIDVDWCGAGFMAIHRDVLGKLGDEPYRQDIVAPSGALVGEDYSFCQRARDAGYAVKVDTSIFIGHIKPRVLGYE